MKRILQNSFSKAILCLLVALMSGGTAWAQNDDVYYTLDGTITGGSSGYDTESSITQGSISWGVVGNTTQKPWRIGGSYFGTSWGDPTDRSITSKTAMGDPINKVVVSVGSLSDDITVNSLTLIVASDANFSQNVQTIPNNASVTSNSTHTFNGNWPAGSYYRITLNVEIGYALFNGTTNRYVEFKNAKFYSPLVATPVIEGDQEFTADEPASVSISCATPGSTILYSTNDGASWTQYTDAFTLTQSTTVLAKAIKDGRTDSHETSKIFYLVSEKSTATWNLRTNSYSSQGTNEVKWTTPSNGEYNANMTLAKGTSGTNANSALGGGNRRYTQFSQNQVLTIEPLPGYMILSVEIAVNNNPGGLTNNAWTNATMTSSTSGNTTTITVTPNDGTQAVSTTIASNQTRVIEVTVVCAPAPVMVTIGFTHYGTLHYGDRSLRLPAGLEAYTYKLGTLKMVVSRSYRNQDVIPAGEAVVLHGEPGTYSFIAKPATYTKDTANLLKGTDVATTTSGGDYYYALAIKKGSNDPSTIGFYWMVEGGDAFPIGAHKAYLALDFSLADLIAAANNPNGAKNYVSLDVEDDPTGINEVNVEENSNNVIYNLAGQRINRMQRGINIVNGKKILK